MDIKSWGGEGVSLLLANRAVIKSGGGFDPDAQAFITAAVITDGTQQSAINALVVGLKADNLWTKMKAIYPIVGGTASRHKYNLKDPRDLDAAFRLLFGGGLTHSTTGILPNGTTGYADTFLSPSTHLSGSSMALSYYSRSNINTGLDQIDMGSSLTTNFLWLSTQYNASGFVNRFLARNSSSTILADAANSDARGFYTCSKTTNLTNGFKTYKNGILQDTKNGGGVAPNAFVALFCLRAGVGRNFYSNRECAFSTIGDGLTDSDNTNLYTLIQAYQTTLGRQV